MRRCSITSRLTPGDASRCQPGPTGTAAPGHEEMWKDALARAAQEAAAWPYGWAADANYPDRAHRGTAAGRVVVNDPLVPMEKVSNMLVGLTPQDGIEWQKDAQSYQF